MLARDTSTSYTVKCFYDTTCDLIIFGVERLFGAAGARVEGAAL